MNRAGIFAAAAIAVGLPGLSSATPASTETRASTEPMVEWRILGPALSRHYSERFSPLADGGTIFSAPCLPAADMNNAPTFALLQLGLPTTQCKALNHESTGHSAQALQCSATVHVTWDDGSRSGLVTPCREVTLSRRAAWHQWNPALGVERTVRNVDGVTGVFAGYAQDSYDRPSFMAGVTKRWTLASLGRLRLDAGAMAGLWLRAEMHYDSVSANQSSATVYSGATTPSQSQNGYQVGGWSYTTHVVERVEPIVVPALTIEDVPSGFGLRIAFAPAFKVFGQVANAVPTLMVQTSWCYRL